MKNNRNYFRRSRNEFDENFEKFRTSKHKNREDGTGSEEETRRRVLVDTNDFKCAQCGSYVSANRSLSGVNNRNHCPLCLWSRHVDLNTSGDRKAECKSRMQPLGLTVKHTFKRYNMEKSGELMLVHRCTGCGKYSINRIAADDDPQVVYQLFRCSLDLGEDSVRLLNEDGILLLSSRDLTIVYSQLYGWQSLIDGVSTIGRRICILEVSNPISIQVESS